MDNSTTLPLLARAKRSRLNQRKKTIFLFGLAVVLLVIITVAGLCLYDKAMATDFSEKNLGPSLQHPFGTDRMGHDMLARTVKGLSTSLLIGLLASTVSAFIALVLGTMAATLGKKVDHVITWLIDLMLGVPHIVLLVLISFAIGKGFWGVTIGVALSHWPSLARVIRSEVLQLKEAPYIQVSARLGQRPGHIAVKHMLPHVFPQLLVGLVLLFPHAILHEASITFLGFGLSPEQPAIGVILAESMAYLSTGMWWLAVFPGLALIGTVLLFDLAGSSLRKILDPYSAQD